MIQRWIHSVADRRRSVRHRWVHDVEILVGMSRLKGISSDLSLHGMGLLTDTRMDDTECRILAGSKERKAHLVRQAARRFDTKVPEVYYCGASFDAPFSEDEVERMITAR